MPNLLHLSDLHFGYDKDKTARAQRNESLDLLVKVVRKLPADWKPDVLVISGDLTWQGRASGYTELGAWLREKLFPATGLTAANCVICPGNHDIDREAAFGLVDRTQDAKRADDLLRPERLARGFAAPFEAFVKFAVDLGIPAPILNGKPDHLAGVRELHGLGFLCANSAWFCRDSNTDRGQLWLGLPQLQSMQLMDPEGYDTAPVTVSVVHHPQEWLANADCASHNNRPAAYRYLAERAHVILSGHTHGATERSTRCFDRARFFVGGAAYHNHEYRNNFSVLKIDSKRRTVARRPWELDPRVPNWEEKERQEYSLRIEKPGRGKPGRNRANPANYIAWLQDRTRSIELNQLHVARQEVPPPAIDTLFIKLTTAAPSKDGGAPGRAEPVPLEEALRSHRRLVIEGNPGCGKTTFVRWIAWMLCRPGGPPANLLWLAGFPIWVRINELDQHIANTLERPRPGDPTSAVDPRWIAHFLASYQGWDLDEAFFAEKFEAEDTVLLLDGLDEAANQQRRVDIVKTIREAAWQYSCRIVVTTRPGVREGRWTLEGFGLTSIDELDDAGIDGFLLQWCRWLKRGDEAAAQSYYADLRPAVAVPGIRHLARNPLMLTSLAVLHFRRHRLPEQRVKLYEQILDWLAEQAVDKHREYQKDVLLERFGFLALGMQEWKGGQKLGIGIDDAAGLLTPAGSLVPMRRFLEQAQMDSGIVTLRGGEIAFWHRSFQEYLAARTMADLPDAKIPARARKMLYSAEGREVLPLVAGCMAERSKQRLSLLLEDLTEHAASQERLDRKAHAVGVLGKMLADVAPFGYKLSGPAAKQYGELLDAVMAIFEKGKARKIGLKTRVAAAEALDQASQARLYMPWDAGYWKEIKGGTYPIGGDSKAFQSLPKKSVKIGGFPIGRFPVTVWEYGKYLETGVEAPPDWEKQLEHPGRPVVNVSWFEAQDYCAWAGCNLPTEEQWEVAARGAEGRIFPWGREEPDECRANFNMVVGDPTPVGMFPDGDTPEGLADMAGNVWDWTRSDFEEGTKCVRGASFDEAAIHLRNASRHGVVRDIRIDRIGFRCVRTPLDSVNLRAGEVLLASSSRRAAAIAADEFFRKASADASYYLWPLDTPIHARATRARVYIVFSDPVPTPEDVKKLRSERNVDAVPVSLARVVRANTEDNCAQALAEIEEPFTTRKDPYDESVPVREETWFYGRQDLLDRLPAALRQGQHAGVFGIRKVGKTSLLNQLRDRLSRSTPVVFLDCQGYGSTADEYFDTILTKLREALGGLVAKSLPDAVGSFRQQFLALRMVWQKSGSNEPFILVLDEADKLFPNRSNPGSAATLTEAVRLFRRLRAISQEYRGLSLLCGSYRADLNRYNLLGEDIGENPLHMSLQEYFLKFLTATEAKAMVREIGRWKDIEWTEAALEDSYAWCAGHPFVSRVFASDACERGDRKSVDEDRTAEVAADIERDFRRHRIGVYFLETVWGILYPNERECLIKMAAGKCVPEKLAEARTNLVQFGLIDETNRIQGELFRRWLQRTGALL